MSSLMTTLAAPPRTPARFTPADCRLDDFAALVDQRTELSDFPHASTVELDVLVYDAARLRAAAATDTCARCAMRAMRRGPR